MGYSHPLSWWLANDIVLSQGQQGLVIDQGYYKVGDGVNKFSGLPYQGLWSLNRWFSTFYPIQNEAALESTLYSPQLVGGSFIMEADWASFKFMVTPANNSNSKTIKVLFNNSPLLTITVPINSAIPIFISGQLTCIEYKYGTIGYDIKYESTGNSPVIVSGTLTGLTFSQTYKLLLQGQGVSNGDLTANRGSGIISTITKM